MTHWRTKLLLTIGLTVGFCAGYLLLQRHPWRPATPMRLLALDQMTPFVPKSWLNVDAAQTSGVRLATQVSMCFKVRARMVSPLTKPARVRIFPK